MLRGDEWEASLVASCPHGGYAPAVGSLLGLARVLATSQKRDPFEDIKGPFAHLHFLKVGEHLVMASLKAVNELVLPILTPTNGQEPDLNALNEIDWRAEAPNLLRKTIYFYSKMFSQICLMRFLERMCLKYDATKLCSQLVKNPVNSALRKAARYGRFKATYKMFGTGLRASFLPCTTIFIVDCCFMYFEKPADEEAASSGANSRRRNQSRAAAKTKTQRMKEGAMNQAMVLVGGAACQALGTLIWPGMGTNAGGLLGEFAPMLMA